MHVAIKTARKIAVAILGSALLIVGIVMIAAPGPAFVVIPLALALLGTEFHWAKKLNARLAIYIKAGKDWFGKHVWKKKEVVQPAPVSKQVEESYQDRER
ncbi:hypothetical protein BH09SUM1_BH09SUM1_26750 [soil metagenome]